MKEHPVPIMSRPLVRRITTAAAAATVAAGVVIAGGLALFGTYQATMRIHVAAAGMPAGSGDAADAATTLAGSSAFLREALRLVPAAAGDIVPHLAPATVTGSLAELVPSFSRPNATERRGATLGAALRVARDPDGRFVTVTVSAYDAEAAEAAAAAVVHAYEASGEIAADPEAQAHVARGLPLAALPIAALVAALAAAACLAPFLLGGRSRRPSERMPGPPVAGALPIDFRMSPREQDPTANLIWQRVSAVDSRARCLLVLAAGEPRRSRAAATLLARPTLDGEGPTVIVDLTAAGTPLRADFSALLDGAASFSEVIHRGVGRREHVIAGDAAALALEPTVRRERLAAVIEALVLTYDHIVIHFDPVAAPILAAVLAPLADGAVVVVDKSGCAPEARAAAAAWPDRSRPVAVVAVDLPLADPTRAVAMEAAEPVAA